MTVTKKLIGRLPILLGEYDSTKTYSKRQRVTLYGSEFESKVDNNTIAPATLKNGVLSINSDNWSVVSNGTEAFLAGEKIKQFNITENPELIAAVTDTNGRLIESTDIDGNKTFYGNVKVNGDFDNKVIDELKEDVDNKINLGNNIYPSDISNIDENPEYSVVYTDSENRVLESRDINGNKTINTDVILKGDFTHKGITEYTSDDSEYSTLTLDKENKIISGRKKDGTLVEGSEEVGKLKVKENLQLTNDAKEDFVNDVKANMSLPYMTRKFNLPNYGYVDIEKELYYLGTDGKEYNPTNVTKVGSDYYVTSSLTKNTDDSGNTTYATNSSSIKTTYTEIDVDFSNTTRWPVDKTKHYCKVSLDFGNIKGQWYAQVSFQGASTLNAPKKGLRLNLFKNGDFAKKDKIKIGEMVATSKFNIKAYYGDGTRIRDLVLQRLIVEARYQRTYLEQYPWNSDYPIFTGATGTIMSFPVKLTTSGNFYGVSFFGLAKDKANYMLDGDKDGMIISGDFADKGPSFAEFYPPTWSDEMNDDKELTDHGHTPTNYAALTTFFDWINNGVWDKTTIPQHLSVIDFIDYYIFVEVFRMRDNDIHNIILFTKSDKKKFYAFLYDLDLSWNHYSYDMNMESSNNILWKKLTALYWKEIVARYKELRSTVLNYNHVVNLISSIQSSIDYRDFEDEITKWNLVNYTNATYNMLQGLKNNLEHFDNKFIIE